MKLLTIDGNKLKKFILAGANKLNLNKDKIDLLNVFPVPDGDTGTNMNLTILAAAKEVSKVTSSKISDVTKVLSIGSLKGARGNSGVILSQLFRGFCKYLENKDTANVKDIANAFQRGTETAYKAVMKPKEGTILTVSKALSDKAMEISSKTDDIKELLEKVIEYGNKVLEKTTNMLPELKQAGVVDAGGKGLLTILEGGLYGESLEIEFDSSTIEVSQNNNFSHIEQTDIKYGYCTEFFINLDKNNEEIEKSLKIFLTEIGDSIVVASDDDFIKVHVHTDNPGKVLDRALKVGSLDNIKIENMRTQHTSLIDFKNQNNDENKIKKLNKYGFVAVSSGSGLNQMFKDFNVDYIIEGGQTMNPSTEDILNAVEKVNARNVFILPNNKNIILAANQAKEICEDKNIVVIETTTIPQGYAALTSFLDNSTLEKNIEEMNEAIRQVITGQVTFAVRETKLEEFEIKENDFLEIIDGKICGKSKNLYTSAIKLVEKIIEKNDEISTLIIYYGEEVSKEDADQVFQYISDKYDEIDVELIKGGQNLYYYIISAE